jgi:membrane protein implicated in regulation of membrane protease activity
MKLLKAILIGIMVVFLAFIGMKLVGVAIKLLFALFWLALIGLAAMALWKMFGPKGAKRAESSEEPSKLQSPEMTLEEYKRKLEAQLKQSSEKRS